MNKKEKNEFIKKKNKDIMRIMHKHLSDDELWLAAYEGWAEDLRFFDEHGMCEKGTVRLGRYTPGPLNAKGRAYKEKQIKEFEVRYKRVNWEALDKKFRALRKELEEYWWNIPREAYYADIDMTDGLSESDAYAVGYAECYGSY